MGVPIDDLTIELINCEKRLDDIDLDALVRTAGVQHKAKYLQILMKNLDNHFQGYFVVAANAGEVVAWTYLFLDRRFALHGVFLGALGKIYKLLPVKFNTAFISSPVAEYNVIHISEAYKEQEGVIIDRMMDELLRSLKKQGVQLVILRDHIAPYASAVLHKRFKHLHFMPGTFVDFEGVHECTELCEHRCLKGCLCFDGYLMGLKKKWRANIRNKINRRKSDLIIEVIPAAKLSAEQKARCHELYVQTRDKQRLKHECLAPSYFHECAKELSDCCKMLIARTGEKIIGFAQLLETEDEVVNVRMGMDYSLNKEYNLYYHLLYENIIYCLCTKKKRLYTSQTCYRSKLEIGAKLLPLHSYFCFTNPVLQKALGRIVASGCRCYTELNQSDRPSEILSKYNICPY